MTRQVRDSDTHPFGHSVKKGSTLHPSRTHRKHREIGQNNLLHDLEVLVKEAKREQRHHAGRAPKTKHGDSGGKRKR
jgi:hypothetical protein